MTVVATARKKPRRGSGGAEAELLFEKYLRADGWTYHRAAAAGLVRLPNGRTFCKSHDLFGVLDFLAFRGSEVWAVQVTTQNGRSVRRAKLGAITWPANWQVSLVSHETTPNPLCRSRKAHVWKVENVAGRLLNPLEAITFDRSFVAKVRLR